MQRCLMIALVLASCSKGKKDAAPSATPTNAEPAADSEGSRQRALEEARNAAMMGVSAPTAAFDKLPEDGSDVAQRGQPTEEGSAAPPPPPPPPPPKPKPKTKTKTGGTMAPVVGGGGGPRPPAEPPRYGTTIGQVTLADATPAPAELGRLIRTRNAEVQACYTKALASFPELVGKLDVTFVVRANGAIGDVTIKTSTVKNVPLESCVVGVLQKARLAAPLGAADTPGAVTITFAKL